MANLPIKINKNSSDSNDPEKFMDSAREEMTKRTFDVANFSPDVNYFIEFRIYKYDRFLQGERRDQASRLKTIRLPLQGPIVHSFQTNYSQFSSSLVADAILSGAALAGDKTGATEAAGDFIKKSGVALPDFQFNSGASRFSTKNLGQLATNELAIKAAINTASTFIPRGQINNTLGASQNPRIETSFDGVGIRSHAFDFILVPRNEEETTIIKEIITAMKFHQLPDYADPDGIFLKYPEEFTIAFVDRDGNELGIPPIPDCFMQSFSAAYNGNGLPRFFQDNNATSYRLSMAFVEQNQLTRKDLVEGGY